MSKVVALPTGIHGSIRQISEETGLDRDTVQKRISAANVVPSGKRGGHPIYRFRDVLKAVMLSRDDGQIDPDKLEPYQRQAHYKAELDRLKLEQETRELIPRIEVEQEQARSMRTMALMMDTMPDVMERDCGLSGETLSRLERHIDDCREQLYKQLNADDDEPAEAFGQP
jgi:uncharacterized protein DUF1441